MMNLLMNNTTTINHLYSLPTFRHANTKLLRITQQPARTKISFDIKQKPVVLLSHSRKMFTVFNKSTHVKEMEESADSRRVLVKGTVILKLKSGLKRQKVSLQLVSAVNGDPANNLKGIVGNPVYLEEQLKKHPDLADGESAFKVTIDWNEDIAVPGAVIVKNEQHHEFYLKSVILEDVPDYGKIHFDCNSWVYPAEQTGKDRIFFTNKPYLPHQTPIALCQYREEELQILRGKGKEKAMLQKWDRVYDYACYNDLGMPDKGPKYTLPVYGGSAEHPYPRRLRTSRPPTKTDPKTETRLPLIKALEQYVPIDERLGDKKLADFLGDTLRSVTQGLSGALDAVFDETPVEFDSFQDILDIYEEAFKVSDHPLLKKLVERIPSKFLNLLPHGAQILKFPMPDIIKEDKEAWSTDEEFSREMLAGLNPLLIRRLEEFPPVSTLDPKAYGNQNSSITKACMEGNLNGLTVIEAIRSNKLFILDHHDKVMPFLRQINANTKSRVYATRTILFLKDDGTLKPLAIELSLPHPEGDKFGAVSNVYTPAHSGVEGSIWQLAKTYVAVTDSGYHQLISHWLNTHAVMEPFVIAANRQLSALHPVHKLLHPHFRYNISINAVARQIALQPHGLFEAAVFPRNYVMQWTSELYRDWKLTDQALPRDLVKRGMAVEDSKSPHGYKLLIEDYPYAVDGLDIWSAIETYVTEYCSFYYKSDDMVASDPELQSWWKEIREIGHGDKKDEKWWPELNNLNSLIEICTTFIWVSSALHAVVNFGQYPYAGYLPNRPTISRQFMPEPNTPEYEELKTNPELVFLKTMQDQLQSLVALSVIELISGHSPDEVYLGQRSTKEWTSDTAPLEAFKRFGMNLSEIEKRILERNNDPKLKNRVGPAKLPFTLLCPSSGNGITGRGIPNSVSI